MLTPPDNIYRTIRYIQFSFQFKHIHAKYIIHVQRSKFLRMAEMLEMLNQRIRLPFTWKWKKELNVNCLNKWIYETMRLRFQISTKMKC